MLRLRQVVIAAREFEPAVSDITDVLGLEVGFRDPHISHLGIENVVIPVGETFIEILRPTENETTVSRYLDRRGGDGGYMVILQTDTMEADRRRMEEVGVRIVQQADLDNAQTTQLHPRDIGGAILSLDAMTPPDAWHWAGPEWRQHAPTDVTTTMTGIEIRATDPAAMATRWGQALAREPREAQGAHVIDLDDGAVIRFVPASEGQGEGLAGVLVAVNDPAGVQARADQRALEAAGSSFVTCGTTFTYGEGS